MRIERVSDISEVMEFLPMEREIREKGRDRNREANMLLFIQSQLENPLFGIWVAHGDDNSMLGYAVGMICLIPGMECLHLLRIYAKSKELQKEFESVLKEWVEPFKIKRCQVTVFKNVKALQRYGWKPISVNMERRY